MTNGQIEQAAALISAFVRRTGLTTNPPRPVISGQTPSPSGFLVLSDPDADSPVCR